jgi:hypothetical protein
MDHPSQRRQAASPERALRCSAAALVLAAGAIHLWLYFDYFHSVHVVGVLFLLNAASALVAAVALLFSGRPLALLAGTAYTSGTLIGFFVSVYHGLFGYVESLRGPWQEAAGGVELAALVLLAPLVASALLPAARRQSLRQTTTTRPKAP